MPSELPSEEDNFDNFTYVNQNNFSEIDPSGGQQIRP